MKTKEQWLQELSMEAHIEGGYFKEIARSNEQIEINQKQRALYSSIYFLLDDTNPSNFHRLTADEIWYFHDGDALTVHMITPEGKYQTVCLGRATDKGDVLQYTVPKNTIFGSSVETKNGYALVSCMVSPAFEYEDFELFKRADLMKQFPQYQSIIERLTKE